MGVSAFQDTSAVHEVCSNGTSAKSQTYLYPGKLVSCAFSPMTISPLSILHLLVPYLFYLFPTHFFMFITYNLALDQEALHSRAMSREAMQCARQCCSANLHSLVEPGSLFGRDSEGLEATHATSYPTCA